MEQTLSIIKPDAIEKNVIGKIFNHFEKNNLKIIAAKMFHLTKDQAQKFYLVHKEKPFYNDLVDFMTSGPILVSVLSGENAVKQNRDIMGATNFVNAKEGTIRKEFASSIERNAVHGSDSLDNAKIEIEFFFKENEVFPR
ncbi:MAG: Nucleoside diphosphate kinase [Candidatus Anoxychlamydiales bacterium]|nr:Nucleoside diphosphate kinase [Candidatus Anoxychlamydiales bacterium]